MWSPCPPEIFSIHTLSNLSLQEKSGPHTALRTALSQISLGNVSTLSDNSNSSLFATPGLSPGLAPSSAPSSPTFLPSVVAGALGRVSRKVLTTLGTVNGTGYRRRALSAASAPRTSLSDDEFHLAPAGPVTVRRASTLEAATSANSMIRNTNFSNLRDETQFTRLEDLKLLNGSLTSIADSVAYSSCQPVVIPESLEKGISLLRITHRKKVQRLFKLDPEAGIVSWDSKASARFSVDKIFEIRVSEEARNYREEFKVSAQLATRWVSIIYTKNNNKLKALHLVGATQDEFDMFIDTLKRLMTYRRKIMSGLAMPGESFVSAHWDRYVIKDSGEERVSFESIEKLARRLHINCSRLFLLQKFEQADVDKSGFLSFTEFQQFVRLLKSRQDIVAIYDSLVGRGEMTFDDLRRFVHNVQKQQVSDATLEKVFQRYSAGSDTLNREQFSDLLVSSSLFPALNHPEEDLTRPLNEYFVSSSHNTYLLGRQVAGSSSLEAYTRALQNGCRCIEIDCWDGDHGPIVCHGHRFTGSIDFADVLNIIRKYGFIASPYPLILSLEVHCNSDNQLIMADRMKSILGGLLVVKPLMSNYFTLPSPADLKHRILVKVKASSHSSASGLSFESNSPGTTTTGTTDTFSSFSDEGTKNALQPKKTKKRHILQAKIIPELGNLGVYTSGIKFRNFSLPASKTTNHIFSLSERCINSMIKDKEKNAQLEKHNRRFLMRVYPAAYRVRSSNFDPIPYWKRGVQMVALNWQTNDIGMQLNEALFCNGGYVLKPAEILNSTPHLFRQGSLRSGSLSGSLKVKITIISAQQLPRPKFMKPDESFDPCVSIELYGDPGKVPEVCKQGESKESSVTAVSRWKTQSVVDNGFNPIWNSEWQVNVSRDNFQFTFVRFAMQCGCGGETTFAVYTVRLCNLNQGYRHLQLRDLHGEEYIFSTLFIKTEISD